MMIRQLPVQDARRWAVRFAPWLAVAGLALIIWGQWLWFDNLWTIRPGGLRVLPGLVLLLIGLRVRGVVLDPQPLISRVAGRWFPWSWKLLLVLVGFGLCGYAAWRAYQERTTVWDVLLLWGAGVWLVMSGLVTHEDAVHWRRQVARSLRSEWRTWLFLLVLFIAALSMRVVNLEHAPYIMAGDEAQFGFESVSLMERSHWVYNPFQMGIWHHPRIVHTLMAICIAEFGQTVASARLTWAIFGALTVPAVYFLGRRLFDARIGVIAAVFMATYPLHVQFSRTAMDMTGDPFFVTLAFAFFVGALRDDNTVEAALAGLTLGLSQYFYFAGRLAVVLMTGLVILYALHDRRALSRRFGVILVTVIVAVAVVLPNAYAVYTDKSRSISPRLGAVSVWSTGAVKAAIEQDYFVEFWENQFQRSFLAYVYYHDESDVYGRYNPALGWYAEVPFMVGLVIVLRRWRDPRSVLPAAWVAGTALLGGAMLIDPPHYPRYISATPALAVLVALGVVGVWLIARDAVGSLRGRVLVAVPRWQTVVPVGLAVVLALANARSYVFDYLPKTPKLLFGETTVRLNEVADILNSFGGRYEVRFFSSLPLDLTGTDLLRYRAPKNDGPAFDGDLALWYEVLEPGEYAFVIAPSRFDEVAGSLLFYLPNGQLREYVDERTGGPLIYVYFTTVPEWQGDGT